MATVIDLTGSSISEQDLTSVQIYADSNINVYEFGNLILADILPTLSWLKNYIDDGRGSSVSIGDSSGSSISLSDSSGSSVSLIDISGS